MDRNLVRRDKVGYASYTSTETTPIAADGRPAADTRNQLLSSKLIRDLQKTVKKEKK